MGQYIGNYYSQCFWHYQHLCNLSSSCGPAHPPQAILSCHHTLARSRPNLLRLAWRKRHRRRLSILEEATWIALSLLDPFPPPSLPHQWWWPWPWLVGFLGLEFVGTIDGDGHWGFAFMGCWGGLGWICVWVWNDGVCTLVRLLLSMGLRWWV